MSRAFTPKPSTYLVERMEEMATYCDQRADHVRNLHGRRTRNIAGGLGHQLRAEAAKLTANLSGGAWGSAGHAVLQWELDRLIRATQDTENPAGYPHLVPRAHKLISLCEVVRVEAEFSAAEGES